MKGKTIQLINQVSGELDAIKTPELRKSALLSKLNVLKDSLPTAITMTAISSTVGMCDTMENIEVQNELIKFIYTLDNYFAIEDGRVLDQTQEKRLIHEILHKYYTYELES